MIWSCWNLPVFELPNAYSVTVVVNANILLAQGGYIQYTLIIDDFKLLQFAVFELPNGYGAIIVA